MKNKQNNEELELAKRREENRANPVMQPVEPVSITTPGVDMRQVARPKVYASLFGETPETQKAYAERNAAFQDMLNARKRTAEQQRTDDVRMARYNALGNVITSMAQLGGWAAGGGTSGVQKYDDRQYIDAFNRAVKAADDIRNIGSAEAEYRFKLADEDYRRALKMDDEARERQYRQEDLERKYQQKMDEMQKKFENDKEKQERQAELRMQLAEYNATHRLRNRSTGQNADWRTKKTLLDGYLEYSKIERANGREPSTYPEWLATTHYVSESGSSGREHADGL